MRPITAFALFAMLFSIISLTQSCKPDNDEDDNAPIIKLIRPNPVEQGGIITITGTKFNEGAANTKVVYNTDTEVTPTSGNLTSIIADVPKTLPIGSAKVVVFVDGAASKAYDIDVIAELPDPVVSDYTKSGGFGDMVTIKGNYFSDDTSRIVVTINGKEQTEVSVSNNEIQIKLVEKTFSGNLVVSRSGKSTIAGAFTYNAKVVENKVLTEIKDFDDILCDKSNNIYLATGFSLIKYSPEGTYIDTLIGWDDKVANPIYPIDLFLGDDETLYVGDNNGRILSCNKESGAIDTIIGLEEVENMSSLHEIEGIDGNYMYVNNRKIKSILKVDLEGKSSDNIFTEPNGYGFAGLMLKDNVLYFQTGGGIYSVNTDGTGYKKIIDSESLISNYSFVNILNYKKRFVIFNTFYKIFKLEDGKYTEMVTALTLDGNDRIVKLTYDSGGNFIMAVSGLTNFICKIKVQ